VNEHLFLFYFSLNLSFSLTQGHPPAPDRIPNYCHTGSAWDKPIPPWRMEGYSGVLTKYPGKVSFSTTTRHRTSNFFYLTRRNFLLTSLIGVERILVIRLYKYETSPCLCQHIRRCWQRELSEIDPDY